MDEFSDRIMYTIDNLVERKPPIMLNLPDLNEIRTFVPPEGDPQRYMVVECEPRKRLRTCIYCGKPIESKGEATNSPRTVHDINLGLVQVDLLLHVPRYKCTACESIEDNPDAKDRTFNHVFDSVLPKRPYTHRLFQQIKEETFVRTFADVSVDYGISETTAANIFDEYVEELAPQRETIVAPRVLAIDGKGIDGKPRAIFLNGEMGEILEVGKADDSKTVQAAIESMVDYDKNIEIVTTDMAIGYRSYIKNYLVEPYHVVHVVDKFHVVQDLHRYLATARQKVFVYLSESFKAIQDPLEKERRKSIYNIIAKDYRLLNFGRKKLEKNDRKQRLAAVCAEFPEINHLRLIKEGLEWIYDSEDVETAEKRFSEWIEFIPPKDDQGKLEWEQRFNLPVKLYEDISPFRNTIQKSWHTEIFNYFRYGCQFTNAIAEGTNTLVSRINSQGYGYSFERIRNKLLYWHLAGQRIQYTLVKTKIPKYGKEKPFDSGTISFVSTTSFGRPIIGYEDREEIKAFSDYDDDRTPLSVLMYYRPENSDM